MHASCSLGTKHTGKKRLEINPASSSNRHLNCLSNAVTKLPESIWDYAEQDTAGYVSPCTWADAVSGAELFHYQGVYKRDLFHVTSCWWHRLV